MEASVTVKPVTTRNALRAAVVLAGAALSAAMTSPAFALVRDDGDDPGRPMPVGEALLIFVGVPVALFLIISLLVTVPSLVRGPRYRPDLGWWAPPVWFGGPSGDVAATIAKAEPVEGRGGASARW